MVRVGTQNEDPTTITKNTSLLEQMIKMKNPQKTSKETLYWIRLTTLETPKKIPLNFSTSETKVLSQTTYG